jgi:hypothetical protein
MNFRSDNFPDAKTIVLHYGLLVGLVLILLQLLFFLIGIDKETYAGGISLLAMFVLCFWAVLDARKKNNGLMAFGQGYKAGALALLSGGLISLLYYYLHITVIDPNYLESMLEFQKEKMRLKGLSEESIQKSMTFVEYMGRPGIATLLASVNIIISSLLFSLIAAALFQKTSDR